MPSNPELLSVVIDEIAFQTNLLALNAAVEAARTEDAGRGFAVVAQEVRTLAQRSAQSSKDIKSLIDESSREIDVGVELVRAAGDSLGEIITNIKDVAELSAQIATASAQQASGIDEVNTAITNMDEMTQRNSALVEESTASANSMREQAAELDEQVSFFTFDQASNVEQEAVKRMHSSATTKPNGEDKTIHAISNENALLSDPVIDADAAPEWKDF